MSTKNHLAKFIGLAVMATLAISAFAAAPASATGTWTVEGAKLSGEGTFNGVAVNAKLKTGTTASLKGEVLGEKITLTPISVTSTFETIFQEGEKAKDSGFLEFHFIIVDPANLCGANPFNTKALTTELVDHSGSTHAFDKFFPEEGEVIASITLYASAGTPCPIAGTYNIKGVFYGEANNWGTAAVVQPRNFTPAINSTLGGSLTLGTKPAELTAEFEAELASGKKFSADTLTLP